MYQMLWIENTPLLKRDVFISYKLENDFYSYVMNNNNSFVRHISINTSRNSVTHCYTARWMLIFIFHKCDYINSLYDTEEWWLNHYDYDKCKLLNIIMDFLIDINIWFSMFKLKQAHDVRLENRSVINMITTSTTVLYSLVFTIILYSILHEPMA